MSDFYGFISYKMSENDSFLAEIDKYFSGKK